LLAGFDCEGRRVPLASQQGIFKPAVCRFATLDAHQRRSFEGRARPYGDEQDSEGLILYKYRGTDRAHAENEGLREAMRTRTPLFTSTAWRQDGTRPSGRCTS
jgi:hypothetical protein